MAETPSWLQNAQYIDLVTFRRSGEPVSSPVWFAVSGDKMYVYSDGQAGKMKRARNSNRAEVGPCDMRGKSTGPRVPATVSVLPMEKGPFVHGLLDRKYGWKKRLFTVASTIPTKLRLRKDRPEGYLEISLTSDSYANGGK